MTPLSFGQKIRELRQARDISLREFAKKIGTAAPHLSDIELGRRYPSDDLLAKIAKHLGVSVEELRALDPRPPVEDLRRLGSEDPQLGFALRRVVEDGISGKDLMKALEHIAPKPDKDRDDEDGA